jgi:predicted RND superfamily exporter protein
VWDFATRQSEKYPEQLLTPSSAVTTVGGLLELPGTALATPRAEDVRAAYEVAPPAIQQSTVNQGGNAMNLIFLYGEGTLEDRAVVIDEIQASTIAPEGLNVVPSGLAVVGVGLLRNLEANRVLLTYLALAFVGLFLAVRLKSIVRSLLSLVPVLIAVGMSSLVAFTFNLKLSPMTAVGGPLVVAACTEFTSLILLRFIEERHRGYTPREAGDVAAARTGQAFIVSGLTTIAGVAVIATSNLPLLRGFGLVVGMNVAVALLSALIILPPMLVWADNRGWVSKGMIPDDVLLRTTPGLRDKA